MNQRRIQMLKLLSQLPALVLLFCSLAGTAQKTPAGISLPEKKIIRSAILGESRDLLIQVPKTNQRLPLLIVFDGESLFNITVSAVRFMSDNSEIPQMPEAIIVGIINTDRNRDMPIPQQYGGEKGEDKFLKFIKDELMPWMNKNYSLNGHTIAIGHSQGGLFASYLLAKHPNMFPWIIALDPPMNADQKVQSIKEGVSQAVRSSKNKTRYASIDAVYGWGQEWKKFFSENDVAFNEKIAGESHESVPFKGIYDGLKFLFLDFSPARKDMNLSEIKNHFKTIAEKYGYSYEIPLKTLLASASRKMTENRKTEIIELLDYAGLKYAESTLVKELKAKAAKIKNATGSVIDSFLALSRPTVEQIKKYEGSWAGDFISKDGKKFPISIQIKIEGDEPRLLAPFDPNNPGNKEEPEVFHVTNESKLIFGKRNRGGGIIINTLYLTDKNSLVGEGMWMGFTIPEDASPDDRKQLSFLLKTPARFNLMRQ